MLMPEEVLKSVFRQIFKAKNLHICDFMVITPKIFCNFAFN